MGRMPTTPDEGYYEVGGPNQWFRNKEEERIYVEREKIHDENYRKYRGIK